MFIYNLIYKFSDIILTNGELIHFNENEIKLRYKLNRTIENASNYRIKLIDTNFNQTQIITCKFVIKLTNFETGQLNSKYTKITELLDDINQIDKLEEDDEDNIKNDIINFFNNNIKNCLDFYENKKRPH